MLKKSHFAQRIFREIPQIFCTSFTKIFQIAYPARGSEPEIQSDISFWRSEAAALHVSGMLLQPVYKG